MVLNRALTISGAFAVAVAVHGIQGTTAMEKAENRPWKSTSPETGTRAPVRPPLELELTPKAKEDGIVWMQAYLAGKSGRERTREDARAALENLVGFCTTVAAWNARDVEEGQAGGPVAGAKEPRAYRRKRGSGGRKGSGGG
jgi:hypothetical protein